MSRFNRLAEALQHATDTRSITIGSGPLAAVPEIFRQVFGESAAIVIADENTFAVAGHEVHQRLVATGIPTLPPFVFSGYPTLYADYANVQKLEAALREHNAIPIAVGSGTLNDLTKLASHFVDRSYMVAATAASMDGYTAFGAAITRDGFKQTFACPAPRAVVADLDILIQAPSAMTSSGYADMLGKVTAGVDWLIANQLGIERIDPTAWGMVQNFLFDWTAEPQSSRLNEPQAVENLVEGLMLSGLAMQAHKSSRPASGSEHQFSHLWEMQETTHGVISHGFKVGVGTIASAALSERILSHDPAHFDLKAIYDSWPSRQQLEARIRQAFPHPEIQENAVKQSMAKYVSVYDLGNRLESIRHSWISFETAMRWQLRSANHLRAMLALAGCPTSPVEIGKTLQDLKESYTLARLIRSRYTILDLAAEMGCLDACIDELFAPGGFWSPKSPTTFE